MAPTYPRIRGSFTRRAVQLTCLGLFLTLAAASCGDSGTSGTSSTGSSSSGSTSSGSGGAGGKNGLPPPICHAGTKWKTGTQAFKDATSDWGLDKLGVIGPVRFAAVDFDGDGWTDLIARTGGALSDDFSTGGKRVTWLLRNTHDGHFEDVTESSGLRQNRSGDTSKGHPGEVFAFGDVNNDGTLDAYEGLTVDKTNNPTKETSEILLNNGDGTFALGPSSNGIRVGANDTPASASFVDFDRDGILDLWIVSYERNNLPQRSHLYKGDGHGGFTDVSQAQGVQTLTGNATIDQFNMALGPVIGWAGNACDLNNDGNPELLAASYGRQPNLLFQAGNADNHFLYTNRSIASGYAFDKNQDWHDNQSAECWCHLHPTDMGCDGVPAPTEIPCTMDSDAFRWNNATDQNPYRLGGNSGTTTCADVNNDGNIDLVTSEIVHWDVGKSSDESELMVNDGGKDVSFTRPGNDATGLKRSYKTSDWNEGIMTGAVFDFDNDGWPDIYMGNSDYPGDHGLLFHQDSPGHFEAVPIAQGIDQHRSHGIVVADFDHDGDLDVIVGHSFARCDAGGEPDDSACYKTQQVRFFENQMGAQGNFIQLSLTGGPTTNRMAIGARVEVTTADGVTQTQEVEGGHGQYGYQNDFTLHFGLAANCEADVSIRWPNANLTKQTFHLPAGYKFTVTEGEDPVAILPAK